MRRELVVVKVHRLGDNVSPDSLRDRSVMCGKVSTGSECVGRGRFDGGYYFFIPFPCVVAVCWRKGLPRRNSGTGYYDAKHGVQNATRVVREGLGCASAFSFGTVYEPVFSIDLLVCIFQHPA